MIWKHTLHVENLWLINTFTLVYSYIRILLYSIENGVTVFMELIKVAQVLKLLGDKTRLSIMALLMERECCVCEFVEVFGLRQPTISQHLRKLKDLELVKERRSNNWVFYSIHTGSEYYPLIENVLTFVPDQKEQLPTLKEMSCE